ncbi:Protein CBG27087 [Caenorhabditis briggsae]|uniref:Protein CBG27087 n=1 Tax=Caenorhabditis briggsae TaxID=6238 RepID=B6IHG3_CAEBR|nr:Protein CBG27087 [Caenorhabditis briggsae]CAR99343.1 Protein CBG27087 [Caenorhabditis briggsae]
MSSDPRHTFLYVNPNNEAIRLLDIDETIFGFTFWIATYYRNFPYSEESCTVFAICFVVVGSSECFSTISPKRFHDELWNCEQWMDKSNLLSSKIPYFL